MIALVQNKALDALEYALQVIEEYDQEFKRTAHKDKKNQREDEKKDDQGKSVVVNSRFDDVKRKYISLFDLQKERAKEYVTSTACYNYADEKVGFYEKYENSVKFTSNVYNSFSTQIIIPIHDNVVFIYDISLRKASLIIENIQTSPLSQAFLQKFSNAKVTLTNNWMKLDLNNDGKVTMSDILSGIHSIKQL